METLFIQARFTMHGTEALFIQIRFAMYGRETLHINSNGANENRTHWRSVFLVFDFTASAFGGSGTPDFTAPHLLAVERLILFIFAFVFKIFAINYYVSFKVIRNTSYFTWVSWDIPTHNKDYICQLIFR